MKIKRYQNLICFTSVFIVLSSLTSCLTSQKMDAYVASEYGNQLPKQNKKAKADITVNSVFQNDNTISNTVKKTSHVLPLVVYWQFDYRHTCTLNPAIAVSNFANTVSGMSAKLSQKLNGQRLELTVEQVPSAFAIVDKGYLLLLVAHWDHVYVEPDFKDLIVSYKLFQNDNVVKTGKIDVKNMEKDKNVRFAQSWKSSTSEYLNRYNADISAMSKTVVSKLMDEL